MSDDWWARKLGGVTGGGVPSALPAKAVRWQQNYPPVTPRAEEFVPPDEDSERQKVQRQGFVSKAPSSKGAVGTCPGCGGSNFFRRRWANTECSPLCTDCGYNGELFTQSGTLLNAVGLRSSGPTQFARTDNPSGQSQFGVDANVASDWSPSSIR